MSTEEQDSTTGRILREYGESKKKLALLDSNIKKIGEYFTSVGEALLVNHELIPIDDRKGFVDLSSIPTREFIENLLRQHRATLAKRSEMLKSLTDMGDEPKD